MPLINFAQTFNRPGPVFNYKIVTEFFKKPNNLFYVII